MHQEASNGQHKCEEQLGENSIKVSQVILSNSIVTDIFGENLTIDINNKETIKQAASHAILCPQD